MSLKQNPKVENHSVKKIVKKVQGLHCSLLNGQYEVYLCKLHSLNHFSPKSDWHELSPNNTNTQWIEKTMRVDKWWHCFDLKANSLNWFLKEMYGDQSEEFVFG